MERQWRSCYFFWLHCLTLTLRFATTCNQTSMPDYGSAARSAAAWLHDTLVWLAHYLVTPPPPARGSPADVAAQRQLLGARLTALRDAKQRLADRHTLLTRQTLEAALVAMDSTRSLAARQHALVMRRLKRDEGRRLTDIKANVVEQLDALEAAMIDRTVLDALREGVTTLRLLSGQSLSLDAIDALLAESTAVMAALDDIGVALATPVRVHPTDTTAADEYDRLLLRQIDLDNMASSDDITPPPPTTVPLVEPPPTSLALPIIAPPLRGS